MGEIATILRSVGEPLLMASFHCRKCSPKAVDNSDLQHNFGVREAQALPGVLSRIFESLSASELETMPALEESGAIEPMYLSWMRITHGSEIRCICNVVESL